MGARDFVFFLPSKTSMPIKFFVFGGVFWFFFWTGSADILFMGAGIFLKIHRAFFFEIGVMPARQNDSK